MRRRLLLENEVRDSDFRIGKAGITLLRLLKG